MQKLSTSIKRASSCCTSIKNNVSLIRYLSNLIKSHINRNSQERGQQASKWGMKNEIIWKLLHSSLLVFLIKTEKLWILLWVLVIIIKKVLSLRKNYQEIHLGSCVLKTDVMFLSRLSKLLNKHYSFLTRIVKFLCTGNTEKTNSPNNFWRIGIAITCNKKVEWRSWTNCRYWLIPHTKLNLLKEKPVFKKLMTHAIHAVCKYYKSHRVLRACFINTHTHNFKCDMIQLLNHTTVKLTSDLKSIHCSI